MGHTLHWFACVGHDPDLELDYNDYDEGIEFEFGTEAIGLDHNFFFLFNSNIYFDTNFAYRMYEFQFAVEFLW